MWLVVPFIILCIGISWASAIKEVFINLRKGNKLTMANKETLVWTIGIPLLACLVWYLASR